MEEAGLDIHLSESGSGLCARERVKILGVVAGMIFVSYLPMFAGYFVFTDMGISQNDVMLFLVLPFLTWFIMIGGPILARRVSSNLAGFEIEWFRKRRSEFVWCFLLPLITIIPVAAYLLLMEIKGVPTRGGIFSFAPSNIRFIFFNLLSISLIGSVTEEIFWRGFVQERLNKVFGAWAALFLQAGAFAGLHFRPLGGLGLVFLMGLIFGFWRMKRKTLIPIIIAHIIINSFASFSFWSEHADSAKIQINVDYVSQFNELCKPANYDPNDNAAGHYKKAVELCVEQPEQLSKSDIKAWPEDLPEEKQVILKSWVSANGEAIEELEAGTQMPYYWVERSAKSMLEISLTNLKSHKYLGYAICQRAKISAAEGDFEEAFSDLLICYRFGKHHTETKILIEQLVGIALKGLAVNSGFQILGKAKTNPEAEILRDFQKRLEGLSSERTFVDFSWDRLAVYDGIQRTFTDDGEGDGYMPKACIKEFVQQPSKFREMDGYFEEMADWSELRRRETVEVAEEVFDYIESVRDKTPAWFKNQGIDLQENVAEKTKDNAFVQMLMPAIARCIEICARGRCDADGLVTTIGILLYEGDEGVFPDSLEELVEGGYIEQVPIDPFSDGPLVYRRVGEGFTLYSVAADFDDDGGEHSRWGLGEDGGDYVFWPVEAAREDGEVDE